MDSIPEWYRPNTRYPVLLRASIRTTLGSFSEHWTRLIELPIPPKKGLKLSFGDTRESMGKPHVWIIVKIRYVRWSIDGGYFFADCGHLTDLWLPGDFYKGSPIDTPEPCDPKTHDKKEGLLCVAYFNTEEVKARMESFGWAKTPII